ncbi:MAG: hypothetical protein AAFR17_13625 [Pseudomonadota bacterium]
MFSERLFAAVVAPSLERVPLAELRVEEPDDEVPICLVHRISQNILTAFDACLSRHLVALHGTGLPAVTVETVLEGLGNGPVLPPDLALRHFDSLPHALMQLSSEGLGRGAAARAQFAHMSGGGSAGRRISGEDVRALSAAMELAESFGPVAFSELTGDFDMVVLTPPGAVAEISIDLFRGIVSLPPAAAGGRAQGGGAGDERVEGPLYGFADFVNERVDLRLMMARLRQAQMREKARAVLDFRAMAEERILRFDHALGGLPLEYHRLDAAMSLIARLKAGLGDDLLGLSEDAQITALDWSAAIDRAELRRSETRNAQATVAPLPRARVTTP